MTTGAVTVQLITGEYQSQPIPDDCAFDSSQVTSIFFCTTQEAAEVMMALARKEDGKVNIAHVPDSAKQILAVYEYFNESMTADAALGGTKKSLELVEIWARGNHGPCDGGRSASEAIGSGHSEGEH